MLQLFRMDIAKIDREMLHMLYMLQVFQRHIASVCSKCFIYFQTYVATVCFKMFHLFQPSVAASVLMLKVASVPTYCICLHTYVASVCSIFHLF
jgi:hypothetical protein